MTHQYKATTKKVAVIMFMGLIMAIIAVASGYVTPTEPRKLSDIVPNITIPATIEATVTAMPTISPEPTYPQPSYVPTLIKYNMGECTKDNIYVSCNPKNYLIPNNEVIKNYSLWLYVDEQDKELRYMAGNPYGYDTGELLQLRYVSDYEQFNTQDYWINPDYLLTHGLTGDCEDLSFAIASIYNAKGIKAVVVFGSLTALNSDYTISTSIDAAVEFKVNGSYYRYYTGTFFGGVKNRDSFNSLIIQFEPLFKYGRNDSYYSYYERNW